MKITIKATNTELTDALRDYAEEKINALEKYIPRVKHAKVELEVDKRHQSGDIYRCEVMIFVPRELLRAEERASDMYAAIDLVIPKLKKQIETFVGKQKDKRRKIDKENVFRQLVKLWKPTEIPDESGEVPKIVKRKRFSLTKPMPESEAIKQMEMIGHDFYLFNNADTGRFSVVYKRSDGDYGIIEPDME